MIKPIKMFEAINSYCGKDTPLAKACSALYFHTVLEGTNDITPTTISQVDVTKLPAEAVKELSAEASQIATEKEKLEQEKAKYNQSAQNMVEKVTAAAQQAEQDNNNSSDNREVDVDG